MDRYTNIQIQKTLNGKRYNKTVKYPLIEPSFEDTYIIGFESDRLDNLAWKYYKDTTLWWIIARANNLGKGDLSVTKGQQLRIPSDINKILDDYNQINLL
jgi:hypothetical protein